jgi:L-ribulokinase
LLLDVDSGEEVAIEEVRYRHGVIDSRLPSNSEQLDPDSALQAPGDYLEVFFRGIPAVMSAGGIRAEEVIGIGVDFTACTVLPVLADGTPMSELTEWSDHPAAWVKLWKHHSAQPIADRLNEVAESRGEAFLARYGGRLSSEWYFPKLIETWLMDRPLYEAMDAFVEATDWVVWQLTGTLKRASCTAGYKACWSARDGLPPTAFFEAAFPGFSAPAAKLGHEFYAPGTLAGTLSMDMADRLGLTTNVAVAVGNVDAFVALPAVGVQQPGSFVMVIGTSICDLVIDEREIQMPGITGVVENGFIPGYFGYEAGQAAVGDMFAWFGEQLLELDASASISTTSWYADLEAQAARFAPGETGLVALDWWNGNRTILGDADLSGVIAGLSLSTTRAEIYRALLESVAYGTRRIIENFNEHGIDLHEIVACGGIAERSPLMMQLLADICGLEVVIPGLSQIPARGSALFGAVAAGPTRGGFADISEAIVKLRPTTAHRFEPNPNYRSTYNEVYSVYCALHDELGRSHVEWLHRLKHLRRGVAPIRSNPDSPG